MRVSTASSYGTLVHAWKGQSPGHLHWQWRLDQPLTGGHTAPDLRTKAGDDAALKLCVMFDHPLDSVPLVERTLLRLARSLSGETLPAATVCYVWDSAQAAGLRVALLPRWYDVDTAIELERLRADLQRGHSGAPHTSLFFSALNWGE